MPRASAPAESFATYDDLAAIGEGTRAEVLAGEVVTAPAPLPRHARAGRAIGRFVGGPYDDDDGYGGPGGWWILPEVDVQLDTHNIVRPDLSGWRRARLPDPSDVRPIEATPDWACEITSPTSVSRDRVQKRHLYQKYGVRFYWLIDPEARTLEALELRDDLWVEVGIYGQGDTAAVPPFVEVEIEVNRLFM